MIRTQVSLTEAQMRRLRAEARRRHVSIAAVLRDAVDQVVPAESVARNRALDALFGAAGCVTSGDGRLALEHDAALGDERW